MKKHSAAAQHDSYIDTNPMTPLPIRLPDEMVIRVDQMAAHTSLSRSAVIRLAVRHWLEAVDQHGLNPLLTSPGIELLGHFPDAGLGRK